MNYLNKIKVKEIAIFFNVLLIFLLYEAFPLIFNWISNDKNINVILYFLFSSYTKYLLLIIFFIIYYGKYLKVKLRDFRKNCASYWKISFKDWFTGFLIMYISNIIIINLVGNIGSNEEAVQTLISETPILAFILTTLIAPFVEEMIFRKCLQDAFHSPLAYMIVSGLIFGYVHVMGGSNIAELLFIIPYGALGFMFAHTINQTDNIFCTIMMHAIHNGALTILAIVVNNL